MNFKDRYVIIMAGGVGSRVWPLSRKSTPKQFQDLLNVGRTMIQQTCDRFKEFCPIENVYVVTTAEYAEQVREQLPELKDSQIIGEPMGKNTAPCIAYAAHKINSINPNASMVIAPSDHLILDTPGFVKCLELGIDTASTQDVLITVGIKPKSPNTGYGYIQFSDLYKEGIYKVKTFTEKPELELATKFVESGEYLWNGGIFIWSVASILKAFSAYLPDMDELFKAGKDKYFTDTEFAFMEEAYTQCKNISIDYGIMEHADNVFVIPGDFGWSDLGTWKACYDVSEKTSSNNVVIGDALTYETSDCLIRVPEGKLVIAHGLEGYVVVDHDDVLMICKKEDDQKVKEFVTDLKNKKMEKYV